MSSIVFLIAFEGSHVAKDALLQVPENAIRLDEGKENVNTWRIHGLCVNSTNEKHVLPIEQAPYLIKRIRAQRRRLVPSCAVRVQLVSVIRQMH